MALLDVLTIEMEADTGKLKKGLNKSEKSADDLVKSLKDADKVAAKSGESFAGFATKALGALAAVTSVGALVSGAIESAADITMLSQTSEALGIAVEEVDAFGKAAIAMGGDAQGARDSLTDMAESIGEALQDVESGRAKTFSALGISLKGVDGQAVDAVEGILKLSDAVQGMSKEEAIFRIKELGITDNRTVEMVLKGRKELEKLLKSQRESGVVTKEQAEEAKKFTTAMNVMRSSMSTTGKGFLSTFIPALTQGVEWLTRLAEFAGEHKDFIVAFFTAIAAVVAYIYLPAMIAAAAATLAATWPIIAIGAAIAAAAALFALAYDDIMNFIDGNDSLIGQIFDKYPLVKEIVFGIIDAFKSMGDIVLSIWDQIVESITGAIDTVKGAIDTVTGAYDSAKNSVSNAADAVSSFFSSNKDDAKDIAETGEEIEDSAQVGRNIGKAKETLEAASASQYNSVTSSSISNSAESNNRETNVSVGEVVVQTQATDADGISKDIGRSLQDEIASIDDEFSTGVDR